MTLVKLTVILPPADMGDSPRKVERYIETDAIASIGPAGSPKRTVIERRDHLNDLVVVGTPDEVKATIEQATTINVALEEFDTIHDDALAPLVERLMQEVTDQPVLGRPDCSRCGCPWRRHYYSTLWVPKCQDCECEAYTVGPT